MAGIVIDPRYEDVDFTKERRFTFGDLGPGLARTFRSFSAEFPLLPERQWQPAIEKIDAGGAWLESLLVEVKNQSSEGSCFPPGTLVTLATGEQVPIDQVKTLDRVVTAEGNVSEVRQTMVRPYIGQLVNLRLYGNNLLRCTPEHPVLTKRGYVAAKDVTAADYVAITKVPVAGETCNVILTAAHLPAKSRVVNELRTYKFNAPHGRSRTTCLTSAVPDAIVLDYGFGKIIGLFLAEGNCGVQRIDWTFNISERDTLAAELRTLIAEKLGSETNERVQKNTVKIQMYGTLWARLFESLCATGSGSKRMHADLLSGPAEFRRGVWEGWMAGDGHRGERVNTGVTISRSLAVQMMQVGLSLGIVTSLRRSIPKPNKSARSRQPRYDVKSSEANLSENWHRSVTGRHCWRRVQMLVMEDYEGPVYNLHVHGDESYVADGVGVHNCVSNATTAGHQCIQAKQYGKKNVIVLSAMSLYKRVARSASSGSMLSDNLDELNSRGALPQNTTANKARFEHTFPATGFSTQYPAGWEKTAKLFVSAEAFVLQSLAELVTACVNGFPIVVGRQGHSILYVRPVWRNSQVNFMYANSWDYDWGFAAGGFPGGFGLDSLGVVKQSAGWAFALRAVMSPQQASSLALAV